MHKGPAVGNPLHFFQLFIDAGPLLQAVRTFTVSWSEMKFPVIRMKVCAVPEREGCSSVVVDSTEQSDPEGVAWPGGLPTLRAVLP